MRACERASGFYGASLSAGLGCLRCSSLEFRESAFLPLVRVGVLVPRFEDVAPWLYSRLAPTRLSGPSVRVHDVSSGVLGEQCMMTGGVVRSYSLTRHCMHIF
jgi:hypothetical protein